MSYPSDFDTEVNVSIDAYDILDYVRDNREWFLEKLDEHDLVYKEKMQKLAQAIHEKCNNEWDFLRKVRDGTSKLTNEEIIDKCKKMYSQIEEFGEYFKNYAKSDD